MKEQKKDYCAIIADIVNSKKIDRRNDAKDKLEKAIDKINLKYKRELVAKFSIYAGDEVQGLLANPTRSYQLIKDLQKEIAPLELTFGVGVGSISTEIPDEPTTWELDGPAYHRARKMIKQAKKKKPSICYSFEEAVDDLINSLIYFIQSNKEFRTNRQQKVVSLYKKLNNQKEVAKKLDITQATVSKILAQSLYHQIQKAENSINNYLANFNRIKI
ncbi:SatD family protein [Natroniella sulfidigena]|uniref:SatD family protein n=1 Tax=Natroniella sulfidigena TaxID=723921 RepID=UPI00200B2767|nr:SatD family protein [Natroniella sulfidigena]MCK8817147.1 SatD family protein [Natroniella sulfidigena]